jgi:GMP synthase-like glutamine amidotransferase
MRIQSFEHVPFEGPAALADWARARGHSLDRTRVFAGQPLPRVQDLDLLFVMGGPMSVHDEAACPWLAPEKAFLRQAVERGVRILGICLGAQMLAEALGGEVRRNPGPEIGWFPVELTPEGRAAPLLAGLPDRFTAFHWHGETFSIPPGAVRLARSEGCVNQAFAFGERALGLQFHLETTPASMELLIENCASELVDAPLVQSAGRMRAMCDTSGPMRPLLDTLLDTLARTA